MRCLARLFIVFVCMWEFILCSACFVLFGVTTFCLLMYVFMYEYVTRCVRGINVMCCLLYVYVVWFTRILQCFVFGVNSMLSYMLVV